jgi:hypothetical protein
VRSIDKPSSLRAFEPSRLARRLQNVALSSLRSDRIKKQKGANTMPNPTPNPSHREGNQNQSIESVRANRVPCRCILGA